MGTRGFKIIKFRGRYWIFYNHYDSYPDGLGKSLVDGIPADPEEYQKWLQSQRHVFAEYDSLLQELLTIHPEDMHKIHSGEPHTPIFHAAFSEKLPEDAPLYHVSGFTDLWIEWTYIIDLDREVFSIDNGAHFRLNHIPKNDEWIKALFLDNKRNRFVLPHLVPADSIATLSLDPPSFTTSTEYKTLQTRRVKPKALDAISPSCRTGPRLRCMLFYFFQMSQQRDLSVTLLSWQAQDLPFRELAFFILCLASGGEHLALVDARRVKLPYREGLYLGMMTDDDSEGDTELATSLGVGYHMDGLPMGSAPKETKYWFDGALICLLPQLDHPSVLEKAIVDAITYGRANCTASSFNAVLMSIEHMVLIKSLPDGSVDHTDLLPLIPINTHLSKDPRTRYGDQALDAFHNARYSKKNQETEERDKMDVEQLSQGSSQQDSKSVEEEGTKDDGAESEDEEMEVSEVTDQNEDDGELDDEESEDELELVPTTTPVTQASIENSFMALIQLFEATTRETLRPSQPNEARLPEEVCEMVLRNISDTKTFNSCLKVSRRFRLICQRQPLVMDNVVFLEPLSNGTASLITKDEGKGKQDHLIPDFLAVEISSDRRMEVLLRPSSNGDGLKCLVVAGSEWNRKTYVANNWVQFRGLRVPAPRAKKASKSKEDTSGFQDKRSLWQGCEGTSWERAMERYTVGTESETQTLGGFWKEAARALECCLEQTSEPDWTLPPNTVCYFGTQPCFGSRDSHNPKYFHYLYLRVKRTNRYRGNLWDDIIREATENLNRTDDPYHMSRYRPQGEVIGADDPYVILAVGVEVRLFKWEQGFDKSVDEGARRMKSPFSKLREFSPEVLNVCNKADRESIERFLDQAEQHRKTIEASISEKCGGS